MGLSVDVWNGPRVVDLFAGAGGFSLGMQRAGFDVVAAYDSWPVAAHVHRANLDHTVNVCDLGDWAAAAASVRQHRPDVVVGGPPCQDFSLARATESAGRGALTEAFARIAIAARPQVAVMENVCNAFNHPEWHSARRLFGSAGYATFHVTLNAALLGVPQRRKRLFLIASASHGAAQFKAAISWAASRRPMSVADYMGGGIDWEHYFVAPRNYRSRGVFSVHYPAPTICGNNYPMPPTYRRHPLDSAPPGEAHVLTVEESARIQTFPAEWDWGDASKRSKAVMVGNAVPPEMGKQVGLALLCAFWPETMPAPPGQQVMPV